MPATRRRSSLRQAKALTSLAINSPPTNIALSPSSVPENQPSGTTVGTLTTTDPDAGNTFTYTLVTGSGDTDNGSFAIAGNQVRTAASFDFETKSSYTIRVRTTDQGGLSFEKSFTIAVTDVNENTAPTCASPQSASTNEDTPLNSAAVCTDGQGDVLTYTRIGNVTNGTLTFNTDGTFIYTPHANYHGSDSFTFKANDGTADSNTATFNITVNSVNDTPVAVDDAKTVVEDSSANTVAVLVNDTDADNLSAPFNAGLTVIGKTNGSHGTVVIAADGLSVTYTPAADFYGNDTFTYTISDNGATGGAGHVDTATVNVTVTNVNDAPEAVNDDQDGGRGQLGEHGQRAGQRHRRRQPERAVQRGPDGHRQDQRQPRHGRDRGRRAERDLHPGRRLLRQRHVHLHDQRQRRDRRRRPRRHGHRHVTVTNVNDAPGGGRRRQDGGRGQLGEHGQRVGQRHRRRQPERARSTLA